MTSTAGLSAAELRAQHTAERTQRSEAKRAFRTEHERLIADNDERLLKEQAAADAAHDAEVERRYRELQRTTADILVAAVEANQTAESRQTLNAICSACKDLD